MSVSLFFFANTSLLANQQQQALELYKMPLRVLDEVEIDWLVELSATLTEARRAGNLAVPDYSLVQHQVLLASLDQLFLASPLQISDLALAFEVQGFSDYVQAFNDLVQTHFLVYFIDALVDATSPNSLPEAELTQLISTLLQPFSWWARSVHSLEQLQSAYLQQQQWQRMLMHEADVWRVFFEATVSEAAPMLLAVLLEYWLYDELGLWVIYSKVDALRLSYLLVLGGYQVMQLLQQQAVANYQQYVGQLGFDAQLVGDYQALLAENAALLLRLFFDVAAQEQFMLEQQALLFGDDVQQQERYQELLVAVYAWLFATSSERVLAQEQFWYGQQAVAD